MTGNEPPEDPSEAPTGFYDYGGQGDPERGTPWYRKPVVLMALGLFAAILLGIALYVLADQTHGTGETKQTPTSPTTSAVVSSTSTGVTTPTEPVAPPETTMTVPPSTNTATATTPTTTTSVDEGRHHHHHHDGGTP